MAATLCGFRHYWTLILDCLLFSQTNSTHYDWIKINPQNWILCTQKKRKTTSHKFGNSVTQSMSQHARNGTYWTYWKQCAGPLHSFIVNTIYCSYFWFNIKIHLTIAYRDGNRILSVRLTDYSHSHPYSLYLSRSLSLSIFPRSLSLSLAFSLFCSLCVSFSFNAHWEQPYQIRSVNFRMNGLNFSPSIMLLRYYDAVRLDVRLVLLFYRYFFFRLYNRVKYQVYSSQQ